MRLNFNNIGTGLEAIAGAKRASDLARESARYDVTEGAYGEGLGQNLQNVIGARDQALQRLSGDAYIRGEEATPEERQQIIDQYTPALSELSRRVGLQSPDYSVASGPTNFATRQEARQAAAPLRAEGLAGVYRRYGDVERADALEARAYEQQRALAAERRAEAGEVRAIARANREEQDFSLGQSERGLRLKGLARAEAEQQRETDFATYAAERPNATTQELKDAAFKQFNFTPKQWQAAVNTRLGIKENEQKDFVLNIKGKLKGKNLTQLGELYNTDPDFDDKTDLAIVPGKGGAVTLNFIDKATGKVTSSQPFKNEALATEFLNKQATEPETIGSWMMALKKTEGAIDAQAAQTRASNATVGLRDAQMRQIKDSGENATARANLVDQFEALTDEEKAGAKGQGLIKQFNLLNVKAGGTVPLGAAPRAEGPVRMDDVDRENLRYYRDWLKNPKNEKLPQGQKDKFAEELGVSQFIKRAAGGPATGLGSNPFPAGAPTATPAAAPAAAPAAPALSMENTKILSAAGKGSWNVQLPDGTTRIMSEAELNRLGYQFLRR